jgi:hypothetical protein
MRSLVQRLSDAVVREQNQTFFARGAHDHGIEIRTTRRWAYRDPRTARQYVLRTFYAPYWHLLEIASDDPMWRVGAAAERTQPQGFAGTIRGIRFAFVHDHLTRFILVKEESAIYVDEPRIFQTFVSIFSTSFPRPVRKGWVSPVVTATEDIMKRLGLDSEWSFAIERITSEHDGTSGKCDGATRTIIVSSHIFEGYDTPDDVVDTILHEIAHALTLGEWPHHGPLWLRAHRSIGGLGNDIGLIEAGTGSSQHLFTTIACIECGAHLDARYGEETVCDQCGAINGDAFPNPSAPPRFFKRAHEDMPKRKFYDESVETRTISRIFT